MIRDFKIEGKYAKQVKDFVDEDRKIFSSNADLFFLSTLIGLYDSKDADPTEVSDDDAAHVSSRTWLRSRGEFENLLSVFSKLEQKMHGEPYNINEIFLNNLQENDEFEKEFNTLLKSYAYYGIDKLYNKLQIPEDISEQDLINNIIEKDLKTTEELDLEVANANFKSFEDIDIITVLDEDSF